jgi:hypothetical protein
MVSRVAVKASCVALAGVVLLAAPLHAARVQIVLDASGSMRAAAAGTSKIDAAKQAVKATIDALDANSIVALRLYGHRRPQEPKAQSCEDTELVIPFGRLDRARFRAAIDAARPLGQTPIAHSLMQAAADFGSNSDEAAAVILVSDGEESCGGDPVAVACEFAKRGLELTIHTVGFDVDTAARAQLQAIAKCTGGEYRDARSASDLGDSLRQLTQAGLLIEKRRETVAGREVRGGDGLASAAPITAGTYLLDHHQRPNEYDYFAVDLAPGQVLRVQQQAYEVGIQIRGNTFEEYNTLSPAGVTIFAPDQSRIGHQEVLTKGQRAVVVAAATSDSGGKYFVAIGHDNTPAGGIHKSSPISIELIDQSDAGTNTDAGQTERAALALAPGRHRAWLHPSPYPQTDRDVFTFPAEAGASYGVRVRPDDAHILSVVVTDEDGVRLAEGRAPNNGAAVRIEDIRAPRAGRLFLAVEGWLTGSPTPTLGGAYDLELTAQGTSAAPGGTPVAAVPGAAPTAGPEGAAATGANAAVGEAAAADQAADAASGWFSLRTLILGGALGLLALAVVFVIVAVWLTRRRGRAPASP